MNKSQFIKLLKSPGVKVKMTYWHGQLMPDAEARTVLKAQSNAVQFSNGSWLYFDEISPSDVRILDNGDISIGWATYKITNEEL